MGCYMVKMLYHNNHNSHHQTACWTSQHRSNPPWNTAPQHPVLLPDPKEHGISLPPPCSHPFLCTTRRTGSAQPCVCALA